jgi:uncharacterized membrane protein YphA (DoxX/SURF4 family)
MAVRPRRMEVFALGGTSGARKAALLEAGAVLGRWLVGLLFVYMGLSKALHPDKFLNLVRQYEMVGNPYVLNAIAAGLPWFEVFCGLLLVAGIAVRGSALMLLLMLTAFTPLVLKRALVLAAASGTRLCLVRFDCGCGLGEVNACNKLVENCLLMVFSAWLLSGRGRRLSLRYSTSPKKD